MKKLLQKRLQNIMEFNKDLESRKPKFIAQDNSADEQVVTEINRLQGMLRRRAASVREAILEATKAEDKAQQHVPMGNPVIADILEATKAEDKAQAGEPGADDPPPR